MGLGIRVSVHQSLTFTTLELALISSPAKSLPMQGMMLYFSGSGVQIFSLGMIFTLLTSPISALLGIFKGKLLLETYDVWLGSMILMTSVRGFPPNTGEQEWERCRVAFVRTIDIANAGICWQPGISVSLFLGAWLKVLNGVG
jgi:hypothetical protein